MICFYRVAITPEVILQNPGVPDGSILVSESPLQPAIARMHIHRFGCYVPLTLSHKFEGSFGVMQALPGYVGPMGPRVNGHVEILVSPPVPLNGTRDPSTQPARIKVYG